MKTLPPRFDSATALPVRDVALRLAAGAASAADFEGLTAEAVLDIKRDLPYHVRGCMTPMRVRAVDVEKREVTYAATVELPDRADDIIKIRPDKKRESNGFTTENFITGAGGSVLWSHNRREDLTPIGSVVKVMQKRIDVQFKGTPKKAWAALETVRFAADPDLPMSVPVWAAVQQGFLKTVSISFHPSPNHVQYIDDPEERIKLGQVTPWGVVFWESDQVELSMTPTPMNPWSTETERKGWANGLEKAMQECVDRGILDKSLMTDFLRETPLDLETEMRRLEERVHSFGVVPASFGFAEATEAAEEKGDTVPTRVRGETVKIPAAPKEIILPLPEVIKVAVGADDQGELIAALQASLVTAQSTIGAIRTGLGCPPEDNVVTRCLEIHERMAKAESARAEAPGLGLSPDQYAKLEKAFDLHSEAGMELVELVTELKASGKALASAPAAPSNVDVPELVRSVAALAESLKTYAPATKGTPTDAGGGGRSESPQPQPTKVDAGVLGRTANVVELALLAKSAEDVVKAIKGDAP